jgi:hypothetical protein
MYLGRNSRTKFNNRAKERGVTELTCLSGVRTPARSEPVTGEITGRISGSIISQELKCIPFLKLSRLFQQVVGVAFQSRETGE